MLLALPHHAPCTAVRMMAGALAPVRPSSPSPYPALLAIRIERQAHVKPLLTSTWGKWDCPASKAIRAYHACMPLAVAASHASSCMPLVATAASQSLPLICLMVVLRTVGEVMQWMVTARGAGEGETRAGRVAIEPRRQRGQPRAVSRQRRGARLPAEVRWPPRRGVGQRTGRVAEQPPGATVQASRNESPPAKPPGLERGR